MLKFKSLTAGTGHPAFMLDGEIDIYDLFLTIDQPLEAYHRNRSHYVSHYHTTTYRKQGKSPNMTKEPLQANKKRWLASVNQKKQLREADLGSVGARKNRC